MSERYGVGWVGELGGSCPVQGNGVVDGCRWYFRARWSHWGLAIAYEPATDPVMVEPHTPGGFYFGEDYPGDGFNAGYMLDDEAWQLVEKGFRAFRDPLAQLLHAIELRERVPLAWAVRLSSADGAALADAWHRCTVPNTLAGIALLDGQSAESLRRLARDACGAELVADDPFHVELVPGAPIVGGQLEAWDHAFAAAIRAEVPPPSLSRLVEQLRHAP